MRTSSGSRRSRLATVRAPRAAILATLSLLVISLWILIILASIESTRPHIRTLSAALAPVYLAASLRFFSISAWVRGDGSLAYRGYWRKRSWTRGTWLVTVDEVLPFHGWFWMLTSRMGAETQVCLAVRVDSTATPVRLRQLSWKHDERADTAMEFLNAHQIGGSGQDDDRETERPLLLPSSRLVRAGATSIANGAVVFTLITAASTLAILFSSRPISYAIAAIFLVTSTTLLIRIFRAATWVDQSGSLIYRGVRSRRQWPPGRWTVGTAEAIPLYRRLVPILTWPATVPCLGVFDGESAEAVPLPQMAWRYQAAAETAALQLNQWRVPPNPPHDCGQAAC